MLHKTAQFSMISLSLFKGHYFKVGLGLAIIINLYCCHWIKIARDGVVKI